MDKSLLNSYLKSKEWILDKVYFDYEGQRLEGRGVLKWNVNTGFYLEAPLNKVNRKTNFFKDQIPRKIDYTSIKMSIRNGGIAIAPSICLINRLDVAAQRRISSPLREVIFSETYSFQPEDDKYWIGSAIYKYDAKSCRQYFLDRVLFENVMKVSEQSFESWSSHQKGISFQDEKNSMIALYAIDDHYIQCNWAIHKDILRKREISKFPQAISYSLSILTGGGFKLLKYEIIFGHQRRRAITVSQPVESLEQLILVSESIQDKSLLKNFFYKLSISLSKDTENALICKNIFFQISEAAKQKNWYVQELLVATTLEATLRNIDHQPFSKKKGDSRKWNVGSSLESFLKAHFSNHCNDIAQFKANIMSAFGFLRDRNAHPDWLFLQGGSLSEEEMEKSFNSMLFLTHFYGYMILILMGFNDIPLQFPDPISQWDTALTVTPPKIS